MIRRSYSHPFLLGFQSSIRRCRHKVVERRPFSFLTIALSVPIYSVFMYFVVYFILYFDLNKRVINQIPGECSFLKGTERGAVDVAFLNPKTLIGSTGTNLGNSSEAVGSLFLWNLAESEAQPLKPKGISKFNPYGISVGFETIAVVNIRRGQMSTDSVELFRLDGNTLRRRRRPITSSLFSSLSDLALIGRERFFVSNSHYFRRPFLQISEFLFRRSYGSIIYFDGNKCKTVASGLETPTGLAVDGDFLFVSVLSAEKILRFAVGKNGNLIPKEEIGVVYSPHFFSLEPKAEGIIMASHPAKLRHLIHWNSPNEYFSPTAILRIRKTKSGNWTVSQLYANDGATLSGGTVAIRLPDRRVAFGNLNMGLLVCAASVLL